MSRRARPRTKARIPRPRSRWQRWLLRYGWILPLGALLIGGGILGLTYAFARIPLPADIELASSAEVYDRHGNLIGTYSDEVRRFLIDTEALLEDAPYIGDAVIAAEDRDFYDHGGVSFRGIVRAAWANITGGQIQQGGSTITQQYVKNAVLRNPERTITRKIKEAVLAIKLERRYDKKQILGFYLNTIYLGRGAYGIEAAARTYFDKPAEDLTLDEAAYFAGIIPAPESYQPDENRVGARERRDRVLRDMVREGYITQAEADSASRGPVKLAPGAELAQRRTEAAYFMEWLRDKYLYPEYGNDLFTAGMKIYTTLDLEMQHSAEEAISSILVNDEDPPAALVSMTPRGEVRVLVGGKHYTSVRKSREFNYATTFPGRQAGSSFKPFTLVTAIEEEDISPNSRFSGSSPKTIPDPVCSTNGIPWEVDNYGGASYGTITLDQATTNSVNTVFAQLISIVGPEKVAELLEDFGFAPKYGDDEIAANCSNALGGSVDVTPLEMARAYAAFAGRGSLPEVQPLRYITDSQGECIKSYRPDKDVECDDQEEPDFEQVVSENSADVLNQVLTHVVQGGTATAANIGRPVAGKTGTTQNNGNAWFGGYVPQLATVVWMGYPRADGPDGETGTPDDIVPEMRYCSDPELCRPVSGDLGYPIEVTGGSFPARIWAAFMIEATAGMQPLPFPIPVDAPDEVINSPAPAPSPTPRPTRTRAAPPIASPSPTAATPTAPPTGQPKPSIFPSPTSAPEREEDDP